MERYAGLGFMVIFCLGIDLARQKHMRYRVDQANFHRGLARAGCGELTFLPAHHKAAVLANTALNLFGSQEP